MITPDDIAAMPRAAFAFPGPLRDSLVAAILDGTKTTTTGLVADYAHENEPLPVPGLRLALIDSDDRPVGVIEMVEVRTAPLADVDLDHAVAEGEGHTTLAEWRADHESFWHGPDFRAALDDPAFTVDDTTLVVLERFRLVTDLR